MRTWWLREAGSLCKVTQLGNSVARLFFFFFKLAALGLPLLCGFSLVEARRGHSLAVMHRLLTEVASLVEERRL